MAAAADHPAALRAAPMATLLLLPLAVVLLQALPGATGADPVGYTITSCAHLAAVFREIGVRHQFEGGEFQRPPFDGPPQVYVLRLARSACGATWECSAQTMTHFGRAHIVVAPQCSGEGKRTTLAASRQSDKALFEIANNGSMLTLQDLILDLNGARRGVSADLFYNTVQATAAVRLRNVDIRRGFGPYGGAIATNNVPLSIEGGTFYANRAYHKWGDGAAIYWQHWDAGTMQLPDGPALFIKGTKFVSNQAIGGGGAVYFRLGFSEKETNQIAIKDCLFHANTADTTSAGIRGFCDPDAGTVLVDVGGCTFSGDSGSRPVVCLDWGGWGSKGSWDSKQWKANDKTTITVYSQGTNGLAPEANGGGCSAQQLERCTEYCRMQA